MMPATFGEARSVFNEYLKKEEFSESAYPMYRAVNYIMGLDAKRFRPVLLLMACQMYQPDLRKALPAALAVELFHNFTLIHDDIMDDAGIRRGKPAVHVNFGVNSAILAGDAMMMLTYRFLQQASTDEQLPLVMETMTRMAIEVCEGQDLDMLFEKQNEVSVAMYLKMIELKTSVLLGASLKIGGILGGADRSDADHLDAFGRNLGIAFQIQDDILDAFGSAEQVGKKIGGDIYQKKKTFLFTKAMEVCSAENKAKLQQIYQSGDALTEEDVNTVIMVFRGSEVLDQAYQAQETHYQIAMDHLDRVKAGAGRKVQLKAISRKLFERSR